MTDRMFATASNAIVIPDTGTVRIEYQFATRFGGTIPTNAIHRIQKNGQFWASETFIGSRLQFAQTFSDNCGGTPGTTWGYAPSTSSVWTVGPVRSGDVLVFEAFQELIVGDITDNGNNTWQVDFISAAPNCRHLRTVVELLPPDGIYLESPTTDVWPNIPSDGAQSQFDRSVIESTIDPITVTVIDGGAPLSGQPVLIKAEWVEESGGHVHQDTVICIGGVHPTKSFGGGEMSFDDLGSSAVSDDSISVLTDANGQVSVRFNAPLWGGEILLTASAEIGGVTTRDSSDITVRVPGLQMLPFSNDYVKLGGNGVHPGPDDNWKGFDYTPDYNHWATAETISTLIAINNAWNVEGEDTLWINDMSLINGGLFDICGKWREPHDYHRVGRDVDIRTQRAAAPRMGILVKTVRTWMDGAKKRVVAASLKFDRFAQDIIGLSPPPQVHDDGSGSEHYHLYFYSQGE